MRGSRSFRHYTDPQRQAASRKPATTRYACRHYPNCDTKPTRTAPGSRAKRCRQHGLLMRTKL